MKTIEDLKKFLQKEGGILLNPASTTNVRVRFDFTRTDTDIEPAMLMTSLDLENGSVWLTVTTAAPSTNTTNIQFSFPDIETAIGNFSIIRARLSAMWYAGYAPIDFAEPDAYVSFNPETGAIRVQSTHRRVHALLKENENARDWSAERMNRDTTTTMYAKPTAEDVLDVLDVIDFLRANGVSVS